MDSALTCFNWLPQEGNSSLNGKGWPAVKSQSVFHVPSSSDPIVQPSLPCPWAFILSFYAILPRVLLQVVLSSWKITWWDNVTGVPQYAQILLETWTFLSQLHMLSISMMEHFYIFLSSMEQEGKEDNRKARKITGGPHACTCECGVIYRQVSTLALNNEHCCVVWCQITTKWMFDVCGWSKLLHLHEWKFSFCHKELSEELETINMTADIPI